METSQQPEKSEMQNPNELAVERNRLASERTLMAWIRTSLSLISFGFTIYKFMQVMLEQGMNSNLSYESPRAVGLSLIGIGTFAMIIASAQHFLYVKQLMGYKGTYKFWKDLSFIVALLLLLLGVLMLGGIIMRSGPFQ
jgi:putative membrane protein